MKEIYVVHARHPDGSGYVLIAAFENEHEAGQIVDYINATSPAMTVLVECVNLHMRKE